MKAVLTQPGKTTKVEEIPVPAVGSDEILIKVLCAGINPTDWKHLEFVGSGNILGCDFVGEVIELGDNVPEDQVKKGEIRWGSDGVEWVRPKGPLQSRISANSLHDRRTSLSASGTINIRGYRHLQVQVLYLRWGIPHYPETAQGEWILIWGGGTAVGQYAIQLGKLSGLKVATTASASRWEQLKGFGADLTVDYKDADVVQKLKDGTQDSIQYGLDCVGMGGSLQKAQLAYRPQGGHLVTILDDLSDLPRQDVKTEPTVIYTVLGEEVPYGGVTLKPTAEDRDVFVKYAKLFPELFGSGKIEPIEVEVVGGLDDVQKAIELLKSGKRTKKMVINI